MSDEAMTVEQAMRIAECWREALTRKETPEGRTIVTLAGEVKRLRLAVARLELPPGANKAAEALATVDIEAELRSPRYTLEDVEEGR